MSSYLGRHSELYDLFYADKPYQKEAFFVHKCLKEYGSGTKRRLLEIACGTGSHAFELEKFGYKIVAIDYSEDMIALANHKKKEKDSSIMFLCDDMRTLENITETYDAAICLFDSIGYVITNEGLESTFKNVNRSLNPGGLFIFEFWHAAAMLRDYEPLRMRRWHTPEADILRISETSIDVVRQMSTVDYSVYELYNNGTFFNFKEQQQNRYFLVQEMSNMLSFSGFTPLNWFAGFSDKEQITEHTWHIIAIAQKQT
jgi:SAM-dependent methyltransferase